MATLEKLLSENPTLVCARSTREHRSTLLHYVSANGVENFRQKTPKNIVEITKLLLKAGADVNAESDAYGGPRRMAEDFRWGLQAVLQSGNPVAMAAVPPD